MKLAKGLRAAVDKAASAKSLAIKIVARLNRYVQPKRALQILSQIYRGENDKILLFNFKSLST